MLTPFIDANVVPDALAVPIALKNSGRFEARLIAAFDPRLAAYPSAYGHDFAHSPPVKRLVKDAITLRKPPIVRRYSFRLQWRRPAKRPYFLSDAYLGKVIDLGFPFMSRLFDVGRIYENGQYNRLCTLEYLCQRFGLGVP